MRAGSSGPDHTKGTLTNPSVPSRSVRDDEALDRPRSAGLDSAGPGDLHRSDSQSQTYVPSRGGTLKKKASIKRTASFRRSLSRRNSQAGSVRGLNLGDKENYEQNGDMNNVFYTPIPTSGNPTEVLANRFQCMWILDLLVVPRFGVKLTDTYP